jgi:hypothetical protein
MQPGSMVAQIDTAVAALRPDAVRLGGQAGGLCVSTAAPSRCAPVVEGVPPTGLRPGRGTLLLWPPGQRMRSWWWTVSVDVSELVAHWAAEAPRLFGDDYETLRAALVHRDADVVVRVLEEHGQLDRLLPVIDDLEALERVREHDRLFVVRSVDAAALMAHWDLTEESLAETAEFG